MSLYLLLAAAVFSANACITFFSRVVTNHQLMITTLLFPAIWLITGMPISGLLTQFLSGFVFFVLGFIAFAKLGFGGGTCRAIMMAGLWIPVSGILLEFLWVTPVIGALLGVALAKIEGTENIEHFAAIVFACCAGVLIYERENLPPSDTTNPIVTEMMDKPLRGLSEPN